MSVSKRVPTTSSADQAADGGAMMGIIINPVWSERKKRLYYIHPLVFIRECMIVCIMTRAGSRIVTDGVRSVSNFLKKI